MKTRFSLLPRVVGLLVLVGWLQAAPMAAVATEDLVPCKVHQRVAIKFPVRPLHQGIVRGAVSLMLEVNQDGQLGDVLAFAHTGPDFAEAATRAIKQWRFTPALLAGEPIRCLITVNVQFEVNGVIAYTKLGGQAEEQSFPGQSDHYRAYGLADLDGVPTALSRPGPIYPREWIEAGRTGAVTVDFFIDENGRTRFARVVGEADELLGAVAIDAVKAWRFKPPTRQGRRVLAHVQQVFDFRPERPREPSA